MFISFNLGSLYPAEYPDPEIVLSDHPVSGKKIRSGPSRIKKKEKHRKHINNEQ